MILNPNTFYNPTIEVRIIGFMSQYASSLETIHIVLSIWDLTDVYNRHASVTMVSVLENTSYPVHFHLLYDEERSKVNPKLADTNRSRHYELVDKYGAEVDFYHVSVPDSVKSHLLKFTQMVHYFAFIFLIYSNNTKKSSIWTQT